MQPIHLVTDCLLLQGIVTLEDVTFLFMDGFQIFVIRIDFGKSFSVEIRHVFQQYMGI